MLLLSSADFFQKCNMVWIQIRTKLFAKVISRGQKFLLARKELSNLSKYCLQNALIENNFTQNKCYFMVLYLI